MADIVDEEKGRIISYEFKGGRGDPNHATSCDFIFEPYTKDFPDLLGDSYKIIARTKDLIEYCAIHFTNSNKTLFRVKFKEIGKPVYEAIEIEAIGSW